MTTVAPGKSITLSDGVTVMSSEPEYKSILRLDERLLRKSWSKLGYRSKEKVERICGTPWGHATFADLRAGWARMPEIERSNLPTALQVLINCRLSSRILCGCGQPKMLHMQHYTCERPGCEAFRPEPGMSALRAAFPDQISASRGE